MAVAEADASRREPAAAFTTAGPGRAMSSELHAPKKLWRDRGKSKTAATSPERTPVWTEPSNTHKPKRVVPVVYYLSRNGHLEQPHFMEVPLASPDGLFLRDVIGRLNLLRGSAMAAQYSWSSKRNYKNGYVWQDLSENDFIYPSHANEYILKGSELLFDSAALPPLSSSSSSSRPLESVSFRSSKMMDSQYEAEGANFPSTVARRRRNQSWSSIDLHEYKVYKTESPVESSWRPTTDVSTQTSDRRRRGKRQVKEEEKALPCREPEKKKETEIMTELNSEEISPPPSDSSPETLETLMKADGRLVLSTSAANNNVSEEKPDQSAAAALPNPSGRLKASAVLMQLITCGSFSFRDCGATYVKDQGLALIGHQKPALPRGTETSKNANTCTCSNPPVAGASSPGELASLSIVKLEDKEYFSGSLIETATKKTELVPTLKRSSSYNADRSNSSILDLELQQLREREREMEADDGVRAKCIPRKIRPMQSQPTTTVATKKLQQAIVI